MTDDQRPAPWGSVIVPAHDEAAVLPRLLDAWSEQIADGSLEVIVVANGCTDDTAEVARRHPGVRVEEIEVGSKIAALNRGDEVASFFPRLYADADVSIDPQAVRLLFEALREPHRPGAPLAGRPSDVFDTTGAHPVVRAYYRAHRVAVGTDAAHLWGPGAYAVSKKGHERFERFPDVAGDDYWIDQLFAPHEKFHAPGPPMVVYTPRTLSALVKIATRRYRGNMVIDRDEEVLAGSERQVTTGSTMRELARSVRGPRSLVDALAFAGVALAGRLNARRTLDHAPTSWERDDSSRTIR